MSGATVAKHAKASSTTKSVKDTLAKAFGYAKHVSPAVEIGRRQPRIDIINDQLCDDVVQYLAPTLEQHKGCTLIDIYPGPCIFSSKLHDLLQPKRHILLEPEERYVEPFIKPLLDTPGSTYRHPTISAHAHPTYQWWAFRHVITDPSIVPQRPQLSSDDPRRGQLDPSLLVVGNLLRRYLFKKNQNYFDLTQYVLQHMAKDVLMRGSLHSNGLTRMLWWIPESQKHHHISTNRTNNRSSHGVVMDLGTDLREVVGVSPIAEVRDNAMRTKVQMKRFSSLDNMISQVVAKKMQEAGVIVPENRNTQDGYPLSNSKSSEDQIEIVSPFVNLIQDPDTLRSKIESTSERLARFAPWIIMSGSSKGRQQAEILAARETIEYPQVDGGQSQRRQGQTSDIAGYRAVIVADLGLRIVNLEASYCQLAETSVKRETLDELRAKLLALNRDFDDMFEKQVDVARVRSRDTLEDTLAVFASPPLLMHDRRPYEPLQMEIEDVFPYGKISLIDMMPKGDIDLSVPDLATTEEVTHFTAAFLRALFVARAHPLPWALDKIAINASKDLIPMVPAITDARKGGRLNPNNLAVKMITREMVEGLVKAFFEWPFRPVRWELALSNKDNTYARSGSGGKDDDVTEEEK